MRLSVKARYDFRAIMDLAMCHADGQQVLFRNVAKREAVSEKYLEQILAALQRSGLVKTVRGRKGGYLLATPPAGILRSDSYEVPEGPLSLMVCITDSSTRGRPGHGQSVDYGS